MAEMKCTDADLQDARKSWATVAREVWAERVRQLDKWGVQRHECGTGDDEFLAFSGMGYGFFNMGYEQMSEEIKVACDEAHDLDRDSWDLILLEEVFEALAEDDHDRLRAELVQVAAVVFAWIDDLDARGGKR